MKEKCIFSGCNDNARYGSVNQNTGIFEKKHCKIHKKIEEKGNAPPWKKRFNDYLKIVENKNYKLITSKSEWEKGVNEKGKYFKPIMICDKDHYIDTVTIGSFTCKGLYKKNCNICSKNLPWKKRYNEYIKEVKKRKYKLLISEIEWKRIVSVNFKPKMLCSRGHPVNTTSIESFMSGIGCKICGYEERKYNEVWKNRFYEFYKLIAKINYKLIISEEEWIKGNMKKESKVLILCNKGHQFNTTIANIISGRKCHICLNCPNCLLWRTNGRLCSYCKPINDNNKYKKTKELKVVNYLKENCDYEFIHNKSIGSQCTKDDREDTNGHLYPDLLFEALFFNLIVEIDEFQHRGSDYKCDERRMYDIIAKLGTPCIFIRYNPDNKEADSSILLNKINHYMSLKTTDSINFDDYGFKVEYLFYKN